MNQHETIIRLSSPRARGEVFTKLLRIPGVQMIYVSALACTRHRNLDFIRMQRKGRLSYLLFNEVDMVTGDYIEKTKQAAAEIAAERSPSGIILLTGCQSALLSTDYKLLSREIEQEIGIPVRVHDGCRLCGFDEEEGGASAIDRMLYAFLRPREKSEAPSVNILGCTDVDESSELFAILNAAGVKKIHRLPDCKTFEEYQEMAGAHVNITVSPQDDEIGAYLEETLGAPWVCLGGIYEETALAEAYRKLGEFLHTPIDISAFQDKLCEELAAAKTLVGGAPISIQGDVELAKWLIGQGFAVQSFQLNPHQGLSREQKVWFEEHAAHLHLESPNRGAPGAGRGGPGGKRPGGGKPDGAAALKLGCLGALSVLNTLKQSAGGTHHA